MKLRLILLAVALPMIAGLTACQKGKKDKSVYAASEDARQAGVSITYKSCTTYHQDAYLNRIDVINGACIQYIDISGVGPTNAEIQNAIEALRKLAHRISQDQGNILEKDNAQHAISSSIADLQVYREKIILGKKVRE